MALLLDRQKNPTSRTAYAPVRQCLEIDQIANGMQPALAWLAEITLGKRTKRGDQPRKPTCPPVNGYKGGAILAIGGKSERIDLAPATGNKLTGTSTVAIPPNAKGVIRLKGPDGKTSQAKFD
jgi:hypothetical protein